MNPSNLDSNHYAFPLAISPVVDCVELKVIRIDFLPTGADHSIKEMQPAQIPLPNEYVPEHQTLRTDLKPLNVIQPEGASFHVTKIGEFCETVEWQKWSFKVGFNQREGMVLYDVRSLDHSVMSKLLTLTGPLRRQKPLLPSLPFRHEHPLRRPPSPVPQESSL